jgi:putative addiction module component (TIGR02574 family)
MSATEVLQQFRSLPREEQLRVAEQIWNEIDDCFTESPALVAELNDRLEDARRNPNAGIPWEAIDEEMKKKYGWK